PIPSVARRTSRYTVNKPTLADALKPRRASTQRSKQPHHQQSQPLIGVVPSTPTLHASYSDYFTAIIMALDLDYSRRNKKARQLTESEKERLEEFVDAIHYSAR
ncbi:Cyclin-dependent kinases regulatory subunit (Cell division control protein cks1), partial [Cryomyces antarcticus]